MTQTSGPKDINEIAASIIGEAIGKSHAKPAIEKHPKDPAAVALGRKGGLKGGHARAQSLSARKRKEIAKKAAAARWTKKS